MLLSFQNQAVRGNYETGKTSLFNTFEIFDHTGSEAVQKAEELKPDLILLDIGLLKLNGIEAARQIRQRSPNSEVIFLSQNSDLDVVRAAVGTGALGYVRKTESSHCHEVRFCCDDAKIPFHVTLQRRSRFVRVGAVHLSAQRTPPCHNPSRQ
jgi:PleD family two-component response regulator